MNILLLTSVYPAPTDKNGNVTKVVQFFATEWKKQGHNVLVVHNKNRYPVFVHMLPEFIRLKLTRRLSFFIPSLKETKKEIRDDNGIKIYKIPILKLKPHGDYPEYRINHQIKEIETILSTESFKPDIIMGHWMSPQAQLLVKLKEIHKCRTSIVLHGRDYIDDKSFNCIKYLQRIDAIGCRSKADSEYVKETLNLKKKPYVCYSGVPDRVLSEYKYDTEKFSKAINTWKFIYVGRLVAYKNIDIVLKALSKVSFQYEFDIVGSGNEEKRLVTLARELGISNKVHFHGQLTRYEVIQHMKKAHVLVMVSKGEVFGLVYLEAMAASCISIGSIGEGIDGVIVNNSNGFLCDPGNIDSLEKTINMIVSMNPSRLYSVSENGYKTARDFSDSNVAKMYLNCAMEV